MDDVIRTPKNLCSGCGTVTDATGLAAQNDGTLPRTGDVNVCMYCGHLAKFAADWTLADLTPRDVVEIFSDREAAGQILLVQFAVRAMRAEGKIKTPAEKKAGASGNN